MKNLRIGSKQLIKDLNRSLVIERIRNFGPISRTDISKDTKLGLSTVTNIIDDLSNNNLVFEVGEADSSGGRRPILLEFNYDYGYTIGIKIEELDIILALTNLNGEIINKLVVPFMKGETAENVIKLIIKGIYELLYNNSLSFDKLLGIGIAVSGLVNSQKGMVIRSSLLGWNNVEVSEKIEAEFNVPVYLDNDVNAYTLAELWKGYGQTYDNFICLSMGAGIGAGIVIDRKLYIGHFGGAGEFGHTIVQANGYQCHCGQKGCLEMYASEKFLIKEGNLLKNQFNNSLLINSKFELNEVYEAAKKSDEFALELFKKLGEYLGIGLLNIINSLNPDTMILVGEGFIAKDFILPYAIELADQNFFSRANYHTQIYISELGNDAWVIGASLLAINQLFTLPIYNNTMQNSLTNSL